MRGSKRSYHVDAGNISCIDKSDIDGFNYLCNAYEVEKGKKYKVTLECGNSWLGKVKNSGILESKSGIFVVGDLCYMFKDDNFNKLLLRTDNLTNPRNIYVPLITGGDGMFLVRATFKEVK